MYATVHNYHIRGLLFLVVNFIVTSNLLIMTIVSQHITDIQWPKVFVNRRRSFTKVGCYRELLPNAMNHIFILEPETPDIGVPCMVRFPAGVDVMYKTHFNSNETFARIMVSNRVHAPIASTTKIFQPMDGNSSQIPENKNRDFLGPIRLPCMYATLVLWRYGTDETFEFLIMPHSEFEAQQVPVRKECKHNIKPVEKPPGALSLTAY